jgi:hypothetical protein
LLRNSGRQSRQLWQKPLFLRLINWMWVWLSNYTVRRVFSGATPTEEKSGCCRRTARRTHALSASHHAAPRRKSHKDIACCWCWVSHQQAPHRTHTHCRLQRLEFSLALSAQSSSSSSVDAGMAHEADVCEQIFRAIRDADLPTARRLLDQGMWNINDIARAQRT